MPEKHDGKDIFRLTALDMIRFSFVFSRLFIGFDLNSNTPGDEHWIFR